jgi:transposase
LVSQAGHTTAPLNAAPRHLPTELWLHIFEADLVSREPLQPLSTMDGSVMISTYYGQTSFDTRLLDRLKRIHRLMYRVAVVTFFSKNRFVFEAGSDTLPHEAVRWLNNVPEFRIRYLDRVNLTIDFTPGQNGQRRTSVSNLIRAVGRSHFLSELTVRIDVSRLDQTQRANFRINTILRALSQIRNVQHLVIDISEPWPDLEAWLRAHMTVPRTPGVNGENWMPAVLSHMSRASRVGSAWSVRDHDRWALALGVRRPNSGVYDRAIRRLARDFTRRDRAQAELLNPTNSTSSVIQYLAVMVNIPAHLLHPGQPPLSFTSFRPLLMASYAEVLALHRQQRPQGRTQDWCLLQEE